MKDLTLRPAVLTFACLSLLISSCSESTDPTRPGESDVQLHHEEAGAGETLLFIHGSQEDFRVFIPQVEALNASYRTVTYSRRYNYPNDYKFDPSIPFSAFTEADDLATLLDQLSVGNVHLAGHSYGGLIAMAFAERHPGRVGSLILSEPPLLKLPGCEASYQHAQENLIEKGKDAYAAGDSTDVMGVIFEFFVGADIQDQIPPQVLEVLFANQEEMVALFHSDDPFPLPNVGTEIPLLFITAGNTLPMLECTNEAFLHQNPEATHLHLPDATHDMWLTHPEALSQGVLAFLSGN